MDYVYHYYTNWGHSNYGSSSMLPSLTGHCSCNCFTCLYRVDLLLLLIVIFLLLMDKITININTSTITTTRLPLVPLNDNGNITSSPGSRSNIVTSTTTEPVTTSLSLSGSTSSSLSSSPNKSLSSLSSLSSSSTSSSFLKVKTSLINSTSPWDSMVISNSRGETQINSERSTPSDPPESLPDSLNSFCSYGSLRRKLIKPDISLDFLNSSSSESESSEDEDEEDEDKSSRNEKKSSDDNDSLQECNLYSACDNDEHFYRDTSLSEETFTNDRITVLPSSIHCS